MANQSTTNSSKKRNLVIAIILVLLLASLYLFKSSQKHESPENEQEITDIVPNDEGNDIEENLVQENNDKGKDKEENLVQENKDNNDKTNKNENESLNSSIDSSESNTQNNSGNNDNSSSGSQDNNDQIESIPTPEQPNIQEDDQDKSLLKFLSDELIKANQTFQYLLEITNEILENY